MNMKSHILSALREQLTAWEALLNSLSQTQIAMPLLLSDWTPKDVVAHLYAWQQRSVARLDAALQGREPFYPQWLPDLDPEEEEATDRINTYLYETYRDMTWEELHRKWKGQFLHLLELSEMVSEPNLLATGTYPWLHGYTLANVLLGTYDHHQEHYDKLVDWLKRPQ